MYINLCTYGSCSNGQFFNTVSLNSDLLYSSTGVDALLAKCRILMARSNTPIPTKIAAIGTAMMPLVNEHFVCLRYDTDSFEVD